MHFSLFTLTKALFIFVILFTSHVSASEYIVKSGDTLIAIAKQQLLPANNDDQQNINAFIDQIVKNNPALFPNSNPDLLTPGMKLQIPDVKPDSIPVSVPQVNSKLIPEVIGHVTKLTGQGWLLHTDETREKLYISLGVHQGDQILTSHQSRAMIDFLDGSSISLKQNSQININEYRWNQLNQSGYSVVEFLKGAFRAVSGLIAKHNPQDYSVSTPVATIGVRGTDFGARLCKQETCVVQNGENKITLSKGIYIGVLQGQIAATSGEQETLVNEGEAIYQKDATTKAKQVANFPGLIFSDEELKTYASMKKKVKTKIVKKKPPFYGAFWLDNKGEVVKNSEGNCIRSSSFRKNHHVIECE